MLILEVWQLAYSIRYGEETSLERRWRKGRGRKGRFLAFGLAAVALAGLLITQKHEAVVEWLIPGNKAVTRAAFSQLVEDLRGGESFSQAMSAFCLEILEDDLGSA